MLNSESEIQKEFDRQKARFQSFLNEHFGMVNVSMTRANGVSAYSVNVWLEMDLPKKGNKKIVKALVKEGWTQDNISKDWDKEGNCMYRVSLRYLIDENPTGGYAGKKKDIGLFLKLKQRSVKP